MKRIVLTLTDEEYANLERRAQQERRTPREMAAWLVTRPETITIPYSPPTTYPLMPWQNPVISGSTTGGCAGCFSPNGAFTHTCNQWQTISAVSSTLVN